MSELRTLYHHTVSPHSRKVRLLLLEKGLPYGIISENYWERRPAFLKINPFSEVPVLVDIENRILTDHVAICEYVHEIKTYPNLLGETPYNKAEVRRITNLFDTLFYMDVYKPLIGERVLKSIRKSQSPDSVLIRMGRENLKRYMMYIDWLAARRPYLGGKFISIADLAVSAHLSILDYVGEVEWDNYVDAKLWYGKIKSRPTFASLLSERITGIMPTSSYANLDF